QPQLAAVNKTFPSQFNPAIGLILDSAFSYRQHDGNNFDFRAAELGLSASIDPFARAYALFTGSPDGFSVEEAAIVTTSLPYNLTVKGGRFFADFGRLSHFHDHALPFVNRPIVLDRFVGVETRGDGVVVRVLARTDRYATLTRRFYRWFLFDYAQDIDRAVGDTKAYSPYLTIWLSEFQRIRLQYTYLDALGNRENQFFLQWTAVIGSHVHGFRDR